MSAKFWHRLSHECDLWGRGCPLVAGVDEAGCGPLAGPVVAAAVMFPATWLQEGLCRNLRGLNDSKQLSPEQRQKYFTVLTSLPDVKYAIATVEVEMIDQINIRQAAWRAMNQALDQLQPRAEHVLVDGLRIRWLTYPQTALVQGDARSYSIAAASVLAKVTRDRLMVEYEKQFPGYGFAEHKGYGTPQHLAAIEALGPCALHRRTFSPFRPMAQELELFALEDPDAPAQKTNTEHSAPNIQP
ncbi:MAG: ribonuclease HII [Limisphaerales bacterium]